MSESIVFSLKFNILKIYKFLSGFPVVGSMNPMFDQQKL